MNHAPLEAVSDHQLPSAQSQGFAHVMVVPFSDPYSTGPLTASPELAAPNRATLSHGIRRGPLAGCTEPAVG
ncbi:hypothetical protein [Hyphomicrobium sp.]|uniref:hypothetical protein n=1 Tax=Hyphomicrobium sp. TaxID=82 RepID=UPI002C64BFE2|nr:hypothetical protein [Hyphomicrobium sp.]HRN89266.1 hypothetical protein [Hyphomicrobium sp.]HRQ26981.1 hypothetical protein [Hyphomicrobium sp.]